MTGSAGRSLLAVVAAATMLAGAVWAGAASQRPAGDGSKARWSPRGVGGIGGAGMLGLAGMRGLGFPGGREALISELDLTPDQQASVREIVKESFPAMKPLIEKQAASRADLFRAVHDDAVDEAAIRAAAADASTAGADLAVARARVLEKIRGVLTPDQLEKLNDARARMAKRGAIRREIFHEHAAELMETL